MSRNILNLWDVDRFLRGIEVPEDDRAIRQWIDRVARRWILNRYPAVGKVIRVTRNAGAIEGLYAIAWRDGADSHGITPRQGLVPSWLEAALPRGVYWLDLDGESGQELASQLHAVSLYFHSLKDSSQYTRLNRVSLPDAVEAGYRFRIMAAEREGRGPDNTLLSFENGYRFALLTSALELSIEGKLMRHCVGNYRRELDRGCDIVSLRDSNDRPHVTIEISGSRKVLQIKGKANGPVAPRYRRYVAVFIRDLGLKVVGDRENAGIAFRPFDLGNPYGWPAHEDLRGMVQREMDAELRHRERAELANFYSDAKTALPTVCDDSWDWFIGLFRDDSGRLLRLDRHEKYDVGGERFETIRVRFPDRLCEVLEEAGSGLAFRRRLVEELESALFAFCRQDDRGLVSRWSFRTPLALDLRRLRHEHQQRVRRRLAAARREMRPRAFATRTPYATLAKWEDDRRAFGRLLHEDAEAYL